MKIEQALSILGSDFADFKIKGNCAYSPTSSICFRYSKMYDDKPIIGLKEKKINVENVVRDVLDLETGESIE